MLLFAAADTSAQTAAQFSAEELRAIDEKYGQIHLNLINDYHKTMDEYRTLSHEQQLLRVNSYLNTLLPGHDSMRHDREEYWSTPKEFLAMGTGDCEDYVTIKYFSLIDLGFEERDLYFAIVREEGSINHHMVLLYDHSKGKPPLVLDNLSFRVLALDSRYDFEIVEFFNTTGRYRYEDNYQPIRLPGNNAEFLNLRKRVEQGE
jgi:predicted transglutaminase-like cysteine proteinase